MIDRRAFANALALSLLGTSIAAGAQPVRRLPLVGVLTGNPSKPDARGRTVAALIKGLREQGFVEGRNFTFEFRFAAGKPTAYPGLAAELVKLEVDVIFAIGPSAVQAATQATSTIAVVALDLESDPVQAGWARSLARPSGNVTGLFLDIPGMAGKWLELLRSAAPGIRSAGLLWDSTTGSAQRVAAMAAAQRGSPELSVAAPNKLIADFAASNRLPAIAPFRWFAEAGGLLSYGVNIEDFYPRAGAFVARILKGARAGELAIELPSKFELVVNLKTARAFGLSIPQPLLLRADEVIR